MAFDDPIDISGVTETLLRISDTEQCLHINRDQVSGFALWREALAPVILTAVVLGFLGYQGWSLAKHWSTLRPDSVIFRLAFCGGAIYLLVWIFRDAVRNAGIVTELSLTAEGLSWQKRSLWGVSERSWPLAQVISAEGVNHILKIHLRTGFPLGAFAFFPDNELLIAAGKINERLMRYSTADPSR